jgi:predicted RNA-binding Zn ribbon-like protein
MTDQILKGVGALALVGGHVVLDFANTVHRYDREDETDELVDYTDLVRWAGKAGIIPDSSVGKLEAMAKGDRPAARRVLTRARLLRRAIHNVFDALWQNENPGREDLKVIQESWTQALRRARLEPVGDMFDFRFDADGATLSEPLFPIAHAAVSLLRSDDARRVRGCHADDCTWLFVDRSKNTSRRWCQMEVCGNREKAKRHYRRTRSAS